MSLSLCVNAENTGNVESYGTGVCCIFRVGRDCNMCRTVVGEKLIEQHSMHCCVVHTETKGYGFSRQPQGLSSHSHISYCVFW